MNHYLIITLTLLVIGTAVYLLSGNIKKTLMVVGGWGIYDSIDSVYNLIIWPIVQNSYGVISVLYLTIGAIILNLLVLHWYQRQGTDWLGVKYLEEIKEREVEFANKFYFHKNRIVRILMYIPIKIFQLVIWLLKKNDVFAFFFLSLFNDSFITTVVLRHGRFDKLNKRDYLIFISSTLLGCFLWGFFVEIGLFILHFLVNLIGSLI